MKLKYGRTFLVGLAFMTIMSFWQLYEFVIPLILKNDFKIGDTLAGFIMSLDNILALFLLPFFGSLSDKTHTRIGRRKPYIITGTLCAVVSMMLIPYATNNNMLVLFMVALGVVLLSMSLYRSPAVALMPDVTPKPVRSEGNAVINLMGAVGGILVLGLMQIKSIMPSKAGGDYTSIFAVTAGIMFIGILILSVTVNEPKWVQKMRDESAKMGIDEEDHKDESGKVIHEKLPHDVRRSLVFILLSIALWFMGYNAVTTAFSKYVTGFLGMDTKQAAAILMIAQAVAIIAFIPVGIISRRVGRKKSIMTGVVVLALVFGTAFFYRGFSPLMYVSFTFVGIAWAMINVNSLPMVLEMSKGGNVGKYTGYYYTFSMAAQVVTPIASGALLQYVSYETLFPYATLFIVLAFVTMLFVKHGDSKPAAPASALEAFDTPD